MRAFDLILVFPENHAATCGAAKVAAEISEVCEERGYPVDLCSYARTDLGSALAGVNSKSPMGGLPTPDLLVCCNTSCDTVTKWFESLSRFFNVPLVVFDIPFLHDEYSIENERYMIKELLEIINFFEEFTGKRMNWDRLEESLFFSRQACELWKKILYSGVHKPSQISIFDVFFHMFPIVVLRGTIEAVTYYQQLDVEVTQRIAQKTGAVEAEKYRLYWDNIMIWPKLASLAKKFASKSTCVITGAYLHEWTQVDIDPSKPLETLARFCTANYTNRGFSGRVRWVVDLIKDYKLDGMIIHSVRSCKRFSIGQYVLADAVQKATGVPSVVIEGDMVDSRVIAESQVEVRIDAFLEMLEQMSQSNGAGHQ